MAHGEARYSCTYIRTCITVLSVCVRVCLLTIEHNGGVAVDAAHNVAHLHPVGLVGVKVTVTASGGVPTTHTAGETRHTTYQQQQYVQHPHTYVVQYTPYSRKFSWEKICACHKIGFSQEKICKCNFAPNI